MNSASATRISKLLSLVLRHEPGAVGVALDPEGWVSIDALLAGTAARGFRITRAELDAVAATNDKQRFSISSDGRRIRARQGHSIRVELGLQPSRPPKVLYHGTIERFLDAILRVGLDKRSRQYVHLSPDIATAAKVGSRRGRPVILRVDSGAMYRDRFTFYLSENGVWLTESVPPVYISVAGRDPVREEARAGSSRPERRGRSRHVTRSSRRPGRRS